MPWLDWVYFALGVIPALAFFFWYNLDRFGSPLESGYALATLPEWLENQRRLGLFSIVHVGMNLNYLYIGDTSSGTPGSVPGARTAPPPG